MNSRTAEVLSVTNGRVTFKLEDGKRLGLGRNDSQLRHIDHAWASMVHAFQGRTVDNVITAMEARHPHLTNQKSFYVEISRARDRAGNEADRACWHGKSPDAGIGAAGKEPDGPSTASKEREVPAPERGRGAAWTSVSSGAGWACGTIAIPAIDH